MKTKVDKIYCYYSLNANNVFAFIYVDIVVLDTIRIITYFNNGAFKATVKCGNI